jgi:hypothetical protein
MSQAHVVPCPDARLSPSADGRRRALSDRRADVIMIACCVWLSVGMAVDAWAHKNVPDLETFFTPWHALFYSGFGAVTAHLGLIVWRSHRPGRPWRLAVPDGYAEGPIGLAVFAAGGVGDAVWHELFGVEKDLAALVSPTHLLLFAGVTLLVTCPLRAAWRRIDVDPAIPPTGRVFALPLLSVMLALTMFSFVTQSVSPFVEPLASRPAMLAFEQTGDPRLVYVGQALGLAGFLVQTVLLVGAMLLLLVRWRLPFGSVTTLLLLNVAIQVGVSGLAWLLPIALLAGLATDLIAARVVHPDGSESGFRIVAFALPVLLWGGYIGALALGFGGGLAWEVELATGSVLVSGVVGLLLSFLAVPMGGAPGYPVRSVCRAGRARLGSHG